jgi:uncharacterized protein with FMN-binding domain
MKNKLFQFTAGCLLLSVIIGCAAPRTTGGPVTRCSLKDGVYDGKATEGPVKVLAKVTIENQRITDINLISHRTWKGKAAEKAIPDRIIDAQSTRVDAVSGATVSSIAIMNAVEDALQKAK